MRNTRKFIGAALLVLVALLVTLKLKAAFGWSPDLLIPVLAVPGFLLDIYPLALLVLCALWILNWQAGVPLELWILAAAPLAAWLGQKFLPSSSWLTLVLVIGVSEIASYALSAPGIFWKNLGFISLNFAFAIVLGLALMRLLEYIYGKE
jgi:hypothetical protein